MDVLQIGLLRVLYMEYDTSNFSEDGIGMVIVKIK